VNSLTNAIEAIHDPSGKMVDRFIAQQVASTVILSGVANIAEATDRTDQLKRQIVQKLRADISKSRIFKLAQMRAGQQTAALQ
jgi:hypothetical protein